MFLTLKFDPRDGSLNICEVYCTICDKIQVLRNA